MKPVFKKNGCNIFIKKDEETGLHAIVAIKELINGMSIGGTRFISYPSEAAAINDAIKLASAMNYKTAVCGLEIGGGKAVIIKPNHIIEDRKKFFQAYGRFINELNGKFITGCDSGVTQEDMQNTASQTPYITGLPKAGYQEDLLIDLTAYGVQKAMNAAALQNYDKESLVGLKIAIQGLGKVGESLARRLVKEGADVIACDIDNAKAKILSDELGITIVEPDEIYQQTCNIFSPCALGGVINKDTIAQLRTQIICGSANNQLESNDFCEELEQLNIKYIPDFVANVGGTIYAAGSYLNDSVEVMYQSINDIIFKRVLNIIHGSKLKQITTLEMAQTLMKVVIERRTLKEKYRQSNSSLIAA